MTELLTLASIKSFLSQLAEKSESVYWLGDPDFTYLAYISPAYETIWERPRERLYQDPTLWIQDLHPEDQHRHPILEMKQKIQEQGIKALFIEQYRIVRPDGEVRSILDRGFPVCDQNGKIIAVTGVATDITDKDKAERYIAAIENKLAGMTVVTASIAHELRTPFAAIDFGIAGIKNLIAPLLTTYEIAKGNHLDIPNISPSVFDTLTTAIDRLQQKIKQSNMVVDMLLTNISYSDSTLSKMHKCSARQTINNALSTYIYPSNKKPVIHWNDDVDFLYHGDDTLITHILFNLLKNSIYFIEKANQGEITIWLEHGKEQNFIHFKDTAYGISEKNLPHIFEQFFTDGTNKGTGIGLAFSRMVMHTHKGNIECEAREGEYTHFILSFPTFE